MTKDCLESTELTENEEKGDALRNTQFDSQRTSDFFIPNSTITSVVDYRGAPHTNGTGA
ncbi:hypothetical protein ACJMK2_022645, partial [Sinanodonta woodiana]